MRVKASTWFLILAIPMGLFLLVAQPPLQGQDETSHFYRAYTITEGHFIEPIVHGRTGATVPTCVISYATYHDSEASKDRPLRLGDAITEPQTCNGEAVFVPFENTALYSPLPYLPQVVALGLTRAMHVPIYVQFYAGRLAAFIAFLALIYTALRVAPRGDSVILVLATLPISLLLAVTYSADTMTISMALLMVSGTLRCVLDQRATWRWFALAALAALALSLSKPTYAVLTPLLLLTPARVFPSRRIAVAAMVITLAIVAAATGGWYLETKDISLSRYLAPPASQYSPKAQISFILHHPLAYAANIGQAFFGTQQGNYLWSSFPAFLGSWRTVGSNFPPVWVSVAAVLALVQAYSRSAPRVIDRSGRAILKAALPPALVVANALLIPTALYVEAFAPHQLIAISGRYFIPTLAAPLASLAVLEARPSAYRSPLPVVPLIVVMLIWLVIEVRLFFY